MKNIFLSGLFVLVLSFSAVAGNASSKNNGLETLQVSGGPGSLMVETSEKSKMTITITNDAGELILSEMVSSDSGKLQLMGLVNGYYTVEVKNKKESRTFRVEVQ